MEEQKVDVMICDCSHPEHQILVRYDLTFDNHELNVEIHLAKLPFWQRVKLAVKYIFGYQAPYGAFCEILLNNQHVPQLKKMIEYLDKECKNN